MEVQQEYQNTIIESDGSRTIIVVGDNVEGIASALKSETRREIIKILRKEPLDVSRLAAKLNQTEANVSAQIQQLQKAGLVKSRYEPGDHGVRKICEVQIDRIIIELE
ncbi:MAG: ArsR family transcriptional regulator [Candidatus Lokiarchaeota archaeon]|nr:ArsR family transcriptional regulator [Candidatus Lokiarchaeota archaeon]